MILDRCDNAKTYLGISKELDKALSIIQNISSVTLNEGRNDISEVSYFNYSVSQLRDTKDWFEFHKKYTDIHVPLDKDEKIAICKTDSKPLDTEFNEDTDCGFFAGHPITTVTIPKGWFLICFPHDAHEPLLGDKNESVKKIVFKIPV